MKRVRVLREKRGWTQEQLGALVGCTGNFISQVERGVSKPTVYLLRRMALALGTSMEDLLSDDEPPAPAKSRAVSSR
jgi:transcriptional regulator with XRE-family HTH domain